MTVGDLKAALAGLDDGLLVVMSSDPEGNRVRALLEASDGMGFTGEDIALLELDDASKAAGYTEEDVYASATPCVVLWPS